MRKQAFALVSQASSLVVLIVGTMVASPASAGPCNEPLSIPFGSQLSVAAAGPICPEYPEPPPETPNYDSVFAGQSVPSSMVVGQTYTVSVAMRNTGVWPWTAAEAFRLGSQNPGDNLTWGTGRLNTPGTVTQGQTATYTFTVTAPRAPGTYNFQWKMLREGVTWFGAPSTNVSVNVVGSTIRGNVEGISNGKIIGWACSSGINSPIDVHVYLGGPAGGGGQLAAYGRADSASEPAVAAACGAAGTAYRFYLPIQGDWTVNQANKAIYVHGISPVGGANLAIPGSGSYRVPANIAPTASFTSPASGAVFGEGTSTLLAVSAADADDGVESVTFFVNGTARATVGYPYQVPFNGIPEGAHTIQAYARDTRGATTFAAPSRMIYGSRVIGDIGIANGAIIGWACSTYVSGYLPVHLYLGGAYGTGVGYGVYHANVPSEAAINNACKASGTSYRFNIPITDAMVRDFGGRKIYLHGISPVGGDNALLSNSGTYAIPVNAPPSVTLTAPGNIQIETPGRVRLSAAASDPDDAVVQVDFYRDGQRIASGTSAPYDHTVSDLAPGTYRFHAIATDRRGATATSATSTVTVVQAQSPSSVTRSYVYDAFQRLCKTIEPETGATVVGYDAAGNVAWTASGLELPSTTDCNLTEAANSGRRIDFGHDTRNRLISVRSPDHNGEQNLTYRNSGELSQVTTWNVQGNEAVTNTYQYNKRNLLVGETVSITGRPAWSVGYGYDSQGSLASVLYPSGLTVTYSNTAQGQPLSVSADGTTFASGVRYHPNGEIQSFTYGNGINHTTQLNARQLPYEQVDAGVLAYRYTYDGNANPTHIEDLLQGPGYNRVLQYDASQRLVAAGSASFGGDHWHRYTYDARDNLLSASLGGVKDSRYWYDARNRLTNILNPDGATITGLTYDVQGNLRTKNGRTHEFDIGNRLRSIQGIETYQYDASGRRAVTSDANGDRLRSLYLQSGQLLFEERRGSGPTEYIQLGPRLIAKREHGLVSYQHLDGLGSPVASSNASATITERTQYEPYGRPMDKTVDGVGYTGHVADGSSGLVYMQQRYYDPELGRFLSVDPVTTLESNVDAFNRYWYGSNNPYRYTDPDGRESWSNTGSANAWPAVQQACGGSSGCEQEVAGDLVVAQANMTLAASGAGTVPGLLRAVAVPFLRAKVTDVIVDSSKHPESAAHIRDAQAAGQPKVLTLNRGGANANRRESMKDVPRQPGKDRDEYPPAMFSEGGKGASVRPISASDNRGAGACMGNQCRGLPDGSKVRIIVRDKKP